ncbi:MAG: deoxyguanosinetriphosphate triphosphohydrolase, partial [Gammaproteobacteria bacterium]|nr:deoxyguanosinetriphosphate triphosphohydrolase [Gammaproteobacteria bacterium]
DLFRTRLTHSIEVAQIARSIARVLRLNEDLTEAIALAHDLGHTPFGHAGQDALNKCMKGFGGFEHNLQSLRVVDQLECRYAEFPGLNLCFETREGILKHCSIANAQELGDVAQRFIKKEQPSLEAQTTNLADEIAYNNHDIDDGLRAGLLSIEQLRTVPFFNQYYEEVAIRYPELQDRRLTHEIIRRMINHLVTDLLDTSLSRIQMASPERPIDISRQPEPLVTFSQETYAANLELKQFLRQNLYKHYRVHRMTTKARRIVSELFDAFMNDHRLLPPEHQGHYLTGKEKNGDNGAARSIADYIAGMTDRFAIGEHERIYKPY